MIVTLKEGVDAEKEEYEASDLEIDTRSLGDITDLECEIETLVHHCCYTDLVLKGDSPEEDESLRISQEERLNLMLTYICGRVKFYFDNLED